MDCKRKIFTERLPTFIEPWAQMTNRFCEEIQAIGLSPVEAWEPDWPLVLGWLPRG